MGWIRVATVDQVQRAGMLEREAGGEALLLYALPAGIFATSAICPHHAAWLSDGQVRGTAIDCPRHMGRFDIATGVQLRGPDCPSLRTYPVRLSDGDVLVDT